MIPSPHLPIKSASRETTAVEDREFAPGVPFGSPFVIAGEAHDFSTEFRTSTARISAIVRLYDTDGTLLVKKGISERESLGGWLSASDRLASERLEAALNKTLAGFVKKVVTDPDIIGRLTIQQ